MLRCSVPRFILVSIGLVLAGSALCQTVENNATAILSNRDARKAAVNQIEATVPQGLSPGVFTVRVSVGADGEVQNVSNPYALPDSLFTAAADAARRWRFSLDRINSKLKGFEADITFHGPVSGTVVTKDGMPAPGVTVLGSEWACCPPKKDIVTTDKSGWFSIAHPGEVLWVLPGDGLESRAIVVPPETSTLSVSIDPASSDLTIAPCSRLERGFERIGWGRYGLQFDVPKRDVQLFLGKPDTDYVVHSVKAKDSNDHVEFWFGPYAMSSTPDEEQFVESETFATRQVIKRTESVDGTEGVSIGLDTWGRLRDDKVWRHTGIRGAGARYQDVSSKDAALFDRIINSACWVEYPKR